MIVGRFIGWLFLAAAAAALVWDLVAWVDMGASPATAMGQHWYTLHRGSLGLAQAAIQRYVWPPLWDPVATWVLLRPTWLGLRHRRAGAGVGVSPSSPSRPDTLSGASGRPALGRR